MALERKTAETHSCLRCSFPWRPFCLWQDFQGIDLCLPVAISGGGSKAQQRISSRWDEAIYVDGNTCGKTVWRYIEIHCVNVALIRFLEGWEGTGRHNGKRQPVEIHVGVRIGNIV